jgi:hypothetical protein
MAASSTHRLGSITEHSFRQDGISRVRIHRCSRNRAAHVEMVGFHCGRNGRWPITHESGSSRRSRESYVSCRPSVEPLLSLHSLACTTCYRLRRYRSCRLCKRQRTDSASLHQTSAREMTPKNSSLTARLQNRRHPTQGVRCIESRAILSLKWD